MKEDIEKKEEEIIYKHNHDTPKPEIQKNKLLKFKSIALFSLFIVLCLFFLAALCLVQPLL